MRIYLNFDGVLHCVPCTKGPFEHLPAFDAVLRTYPTVEVVISSSYREVLPLDVMRVWFSRDTQHQIIDITPVLPDSKRVDEIRAHIKATDYHQRFIVLDDDPFEFPRNYRPLILCQTAYGLGERELTELLNRLSNKNLTLKDIDELVYSGTLPDGPKSEFSASKPKPRRWPKNRSSEIVWDDTPPIDGKK